MNSRSELSVDWWSCCRHVKLRVANALLTLLKLFRSTYMVSSTQTNRQLYFLYDTLLLLLYIYIYIYLCMYVYIHTYVQSVDVFRCTTAYQCGSERTWIDKGPECSNRYSSGGHCLTLSVILIYPHSFFYFYYYYYLILFKTR